MQTVDHEVTQRTTAIHKFYCDNCNKFLGQSEEYDDGYYEQLGEYEQSICIRHGGSHWLRLRKCLCEKCSDELTNKLENTLIDLGFKYDVTYK